MASNTFDVYFPVDNFIKNEIWNSYERTEQDVVADVNLLKAWLTKQKHIPNVEDDRVLHILLLRNKFRIEKTKEKIDKYFSAKTAYLSLYKELDPWSDGQKKVQKYVILCPMPKLTPAFDRIVYVKVLNKPGVVYDFKDYVNLYCMLCDLRIFNDYTGSEIVLFDLENYGLSQIKQIDTSTLARNIHLYTECYSGRMAQIHLINHAGFIDVLLAILRPFLPSKIMSRIHVHKTLDSLYKIIPEEYLPTEIGGTSGVSSYDVHRTLCESMGLNRHKIVENNNLRTIESLRTQALPVNTQSFGMDGTFRKINID